MKRREFCVAGAIISIGAVTAAHAQRQPALIGYLYFGSRDSNPAFASFKEGLAAHGLKEGSDIIIDARWANGQVDEMRRLAQALAAKKPAVIVATSARTVEAALKAAPHTPIVQATGTDPVAAGFASSLARPGGMVTGLSNLNLDIAEKLLELLLTTAPKLRKSCRALMSSWRESLRTGMRRASSLA